MELNHNAKSVYEALGASEEELNRIVEESVIAYNQTLTNGDCDSKAYAVISETVRKNILGENNAKVTQYEAVLAAVAFKMGESLLGSNLMTAIGENLKMLKMGLEIKMPPQLLFPAAMAVVTKMVETIGSGHECTKCGKCGRTFDEDSKE